MRTLTLLLLTLIALSAGYGQDPTAKQTAASEVAEIVVGQWQKQDDGKVDWKVVRQEAAAAYANAFSESELTELKNFYTSKVGQKTLAFDQRLRSDVFERTVILERRKKLEAEALANTEKLIAGMPLAARAALTVAMKSKSFPADLVFGKWYSRTKDEFGESYVVHEKAKSGVNTWRSMDIFHDDKTFEDAKGKGIWLIRGRLLIESDTDTPEPFLYIIQDLTKDKLKYVIADSEVPVSEWEGQSDNRTAFEFPARPKGYRDESP